MSNILTIQRGSYGLTYVLTYQTSGGTAKDLTGCTAVYLVVWQSGNPQLVMLKGTCSISMPLTSGIVTYTSAVGDFVMAGTFSAELQADSASANDPSQSFIIQVNEAV